MKNKDAQDTNVVRQRLLERIREARLPHNSETFKWQELAAAGLFSTFKRREGWNDASFRLFVLFAVQTRELRKQRDSLRRRVEVLEDYCSPLWDDVWKELCPIKQAELHRKAQEDDARVNEQRRKERDPLAAFKIPGTFAPVKSWKRRDARRPLLRYKPARWNEPMTIMDYHHATSLSRRTVHNILKRARARPLRSRKRRNEPAQFGRNASVVVLRKWLTRYVKDRDKRKALIARTLLHCEQETPEHLEFLRKAISPALKSLRLKEVDFSRYLTDCRKILYPPTPRLSLLPTSLLESLDSQAR